ncbi:MAG: ATP cone domain-containing protein [Candidatus Taylorbacteria bacterium]|nr:ATP cone domain-containing protein [Candidatus Taylorbacteria bacterium]
MPKKKKSALGQAAKTVVIPTIIKRDGRIVPFDIEKVTNAVWKGMNTVNEGSLEDARMVAGQVLAELMRIKRKFSNFVPTVEGIQDIVEAELMRSDFVKTARHYVLYREERAQIRAKGMEVPENIRKLAASSQKYFRNALGEFVYYRTYSRWIDAEQRRETWIETVDRYMEFMRENIGKKLSPAEYKDVRESILKQEAIPSMRLLQFAGPAARRTNVCGYNCSYIAPESFQDLSEIMYISMNGTGVGFSAESANVQKFPQILMQGGEKLKTHIIDDSKEGWCRSFVVGATTWASGKDVDFDFSLIRPLGARLKVGGGKASGPEPLKRLLAFTKDVMMARQGRRLRNIDVHDIICMMGECIVSGGVRRSALISLSDLDDPEIRDAKKGAFYITHPHRSLANNSAVYTNKPTNEEFLKEWMALIESRSGERGIFNRGSLAKTLPERRIEALKSYKGYFDSSGQHIVGPIGTNPCGEIILQSKQFCNLSEVVARAEDTEKSLMKKIRVAAILGTYQSMLTHFEYLSKEWKEHCEKERLLGVSITGQWDCPAVRKPEVMRRLRDEAIKINKEYAKRFGLNESTAITCVKPSGNGSQTFDCSSGMHPRHAKYYIRRARIASTDALFKMLKDQGVPYHPEVGQTIENATTFVLEFPVKAPQGTTTFKNDLTALQQLEYWKMVKVNFTEHNPSITISVGNDEWIAVANWVYENWDIVGGLSFLPREDHIYKLAPYEAIDEETYKELSKRMEHIDYSKIITYEKQNETDLKKELACASGVCEVL